MAGVAAITCVLTLVPGQGAAGEVVPADPVRPPFKFSAPECTYVSRGEPGAAGNELRISSGDRAFFAFIEISDRDGKLRIRGTRNCDGPRKPRLDNIDSIAINLDKARYPFVSVRTSRSALGPGATRETDGASEIEISSARMRGSIEIHLGGSDDAVTSESTDEDTVGANLTAARDGDVDVRGSIRTGLGLFLGDGDDGYSQPAVPRARGGSLGFTGAFVSGDSGDDVLEGASGSDFFDGGSGSDTLVGLGRFDYLLGSEDEDVIQGDGAGDILDARHGADDVAGGAGEDFIVAADGRHDEIDCGNDDDFATVDRHRDDYDNCEDIRTRRGLELKLGSQRQDAVDRARSYFEHSG